MTTCKNGHPWTPENTSLRPNGHRRCRVCVKESNFRTWRTRRDLKFHLRGASGDQAHCGVKGEKVLTDVRSEATCKRCNGEFYRTRSRPWADPPVKGET